MQSLQDALQQSEKNGVAIGHFNVADLVLLKAVAAAARDLKVPVAVGASEGEREFLGVRQIAALVRSLREEYDYPIFLNADHTHSLAHVLIPEEAAPQFRDDAAPRNGMMPPPDSEMIAPPITE